ncbi:predicted protein [Plenodomus lingam JN3]|uniref:Predicted protein n=1 Tax=Leptosphaeria maculans (strain JN3 / isolate v23.1.3 / race Av1-4-5-6-7-8) TaxID=985895 RepID=E5A1G4_LEPMJ|nr:predicted protein [Plenodomus lingam JN3]CBX97428.1 predicted protein [Plenodomus lingam JN3]
MHVPTLLTTLVSLVLLTGTTLAAPTPQLEGILGALTLPTAGTGNQVGGKGVENANGNMKGNGKGNNTGNNKGTGNTAGTGNEAVKGNALALPLLGARSEQQKQRGDLGSVVGTITQPAVGLGHALLGNGKIAVLGTKLAMEIFFS